MRASPSWPYLTSLPSKAQSPNTTTLGIKAFQHMNCGSRGHNSVHSNDNWANSWRSGGVNHLNIRKSVPGRASSKGKGPELEQCLRVSEQWRGLHCWSKWARGRELRDQEGGADRIGLCKPLQGPEFWGGGVVCLFLFKTWIYLERYTFHRQNAVHLKRWKWPWENHTPQTECGPSQKVRGQDLSFYSERNGEPLAGSKSLLEKRFPE